MTRKSIILWIAATILLLLIIMALIHSFVRYNELNRYGKFAIAKLGSYDKGFRGQYILYFDLDINGKTVRLEGLKDLPYVGIVDSFHKYGLPVVYSSKDYNHFSLLINCEAFTKYNIEVPASFAFLNCK